MSEALKAATIDVMDTLTATPRTTSAQRPTLQARARPTHIPLSSQQQRLWVLDRLAGSSAEYNGCNAWRLRGRLDAAALGRALTAVVARHESLRTHFADVDGTPSQVIDPPCPVDLPIEDVRAMGPEARAAAVQAAQRAEVTTPFDLARGPLFRARLLRLADDDHVLLHTCHHIVSDAWSQTLFHQELVERYAAEVEGRARVDAPLTVQYADYALWQREWLDASAVDASLAYWRRQLAGVPERLELPLDRPRPAEATYVAEQVCTIIPAAHLRALDRVGRRSRTTRFMQLLTAFGAVLARHSGQDDFVVGVPITSRPDVRLESLIGFFVNSLVLRMRPSLAQPLEVLLADVRQTTLEAYRHQDVPFERLVDALAPSRTLNASPVFQVLFALQNVPRAASRVPGLTIDPEPSPELRVRFDLEVHACPRGDEIAVTWLYNRALFDRWRIDQMARHFTRMVAALGEDASQCVGDVPLLDAAERRHLLDTWNATDTWLDTTPLAVHVAQQAARTPDAIAVSYEDEALSYAMLQRRVNGLARQLAARGVRVETRVGLCVPRTTDMAVAMLGAIAAGAAYVPLDPSFPDERLRFMVEDADVAIVVTAGDLSSRVPTGVSVLALTDVEADDPPPVDVPAQALLYVLYTSGSTGQPKGVAMPHAPLINLLAWRHATAPAPDRTLQYASLGFDASIHEMLAAWRSGGTVCIVSEAMRRDVMGLRALMAARGIGAAILPVVTAQCLADEWGLADEGEVSDVGALRELTTTGEALVLTPSLRAFGAARVLHNHYGPTETHVVTSHTLTGAADAWPDQPSIGTPIWNTRVYVLDSQLEPVPIGVTGELYLAGVMLARGYLRRPGATAARFVPDPHGASGTRMYRTGDQARWLPDGTLEFLGRNDGQVKIRGFRVELAEIAAALRRDPRVHDAVATVTGSGEQRRLIAYVVPVRDAAEGSADGPALGASLREMLREHLPEYTIPAWIGVVEAWPLTHNGKLDRAALPPPVWTTTAESRPPTRAEEVQLCAVLTEVLGVDRVGLDDNFFALGGDSLAAIHLVSRAHRAGLEISARDVFRCRTVEALAAAIVSRISERPGVRG